MISNIKYTTIYSKIWPKSGRGVFRTLLNVRSSRLEVFRKKDVLRNFAKFTGKQLPEACNFIEKEKETPAQVFSCGFSEISKNTFFTEHPRGLLLKRLSKGVSP